jgi:hypothetical protein
MQPAFKHVGFGQCLLIPCFFGPNLEAEAQEQFSCSMLRLRLRPGTSGDFHTMEGEFVSIYGENQDKVNTSSPPSVDSQGQVRLGRTVHSSSARLSENIDTDKDSLGTIYEGSVPGS